ncbi:hypothetical protein [Helicobacter gastrofelis]|uniref:hypothetical protein n=1 Tax=Helicobacter gastrofelis TaxID=2849642 RepID=UPI001C8560A8|nr:hypothetical protein [Helicobacter sp. NHP19-012]
MGFKTKIISVLAVLLILVFGTTIVIIGVKIRNNLTQQAQASLKTNINILSSTIKEWDRNTLSILRQTAHSFEKMSLNDTGQVKQVLEFTNDNMNSADMYVAFEDGRIIKLQGNEPTGYDPRIRSWYQNAKAAMDVSISKPYIDAYTKKSLLPILWP